MLESPWRKIYVKFFYDKILCWCLLAERLTWWVPLVEQELLTHTEHLSSPPVFSGVHVTRSLVLYVCFVDRCLSFCTFSFGHCVVCSSSIYGFWLPLWHLQTLHVKLFFDKILCWSLPEERFMLNSSLIKFYAEVSLKKD